jgi:hypothetical protein
MRNRSATTSIAEVLDFFHPQERREKNIYVEISMPLTLCLRWNFNATDTLCWNFNATDTSFMLKFQCHWVCLCWNFNATDSLFMLKFQCHWQFVYVEISTPLTLRLCWNFNATDTSFMLKFQCHWHFELEQCVWLWSCLVLDRSFEVRTVLVMFTCPLCHMLSVIRDTE